MSAPEMLITILHFTTDGQTYRNEKLWRSVCTFCVKIWPDCCWCALMSVNHITYCNCTRTPRVLWRVCESLAIFKYFTAESHSCIFCSPSTSRETKLQLRLFPKVFLVSYLVSEAFSKFRLHRFLFLFLTSTVNGSILKSDQTTWESSGDRERRAMGGLGISRGNQNESGIWIWGKVWSCVRMCGRNKG